MKATIDRIEENMVIAECENGEYITLERNLLRNVKEGDHVIISADSVTVTEHTDTKSIFKKLRNKKK